MPSLEVWKAFSADVERAAGGRWDTILSALAGAGLSDALKRPGYHVSCPAHGGTDGFRLFKDYADTGGGICNTCGAFSSGFKLLMWLNRWEYKDAVVAVGEVLGMSVDGAPAPAKVVAIRPAPKPAAKPGPEQAERIRVAHRDKYKRAFPLSHPAAEPARRYLASRGLSIQDEDLPRSLKFAPRLAYYHLGERQGEWPALIAPMQAPDGRLLNIHKTYLTEAGEKAPVDEVKQTGKAPYQGVMSGSAIRLAQVSRTLAVAEGIETALAVQQMTGLPTWSTANATLLEQFMPPPEVSVLLIWADLDRFIWPDLKRSSRGSKAAEALSKRMRDTGILSVTLLPDGPVPRGQKSVDWLDVFAFSVPGAVMDTADIVRRFMRV